MDPGALLWNSSMLLLLFACKSCYYAHIILCSFHNWENTLNLKRDKRPSDWHPSLPALNRHCCHQWSECYSPDAGCHFPEFIQLTLHVPNVHVFAAMWRFAHAPCYQYSGTMLKCFWLAIISHIMLSIIDSSLAPRPCHVDMDCLLAHFHICS